MDEVHLPALQATVTDFIEPELDGDGEIKAIVLQSFKGGSLAEAASAPYVQEE